MAVYLYSTKGCKYRQLHALMDLISGLQEMNEVEFIVPFSQNRRPLKDTRVSIIEKLNKSKEQQKNRFCND